MINTTTGTTEINHTVSNNNTWQTLYNLSAGNTYQLQISVTGKATTGTAYFTYQATIGATHYATINSGGARIAKVITSDNVSNSTMVKKYNYNLPGTSQSSGSAMFTPKYEKVLKVLSSYHDPNLAPSCDPTAVKFLSMYSSSQDNLYIYGSSPTVYSNVEETFGENGENGKIVHVYTVYSDASTDTYWGQDMLGVPCTNNSYKNGKETYTEISKKNGSGYTPVKKVFTHFKEDPRMDHVLHNYIGSKNYVNSEEACQAQDEAFSQFYLGQFDLSGYRTYQKWIYADTVKTWTYDTGGQNYIEEKTVTEYGNPQHALATKVTIFTSDGASKTVTNSYPPDLSLLGDAETGRQALVSRSISPVLKQSVAQNSNILYTLNSDYSVFSNGLVLPKKKMIQVSTNPLETRIEFNSYDIKGNIEDESNSNGPHVSYIWAYNKQYPIAKVTNAKVNDIFHDNFENGNGNSTVNDSKTGHYSHTGLYIKTLVGLDMGSYILSYWQKSGTVWSQISTTVSLSGATYTISLNAQIDDVRFYPATALMSTSTYDPLVGLTSTTDEKGVSNYYEYDNFQRLINIKDKDGKIVKHMDYHYQGQ